MKRIIYILLIIIFFVFNGISQSKFSLSANLQYGYHIKDKVHGFGIGSILDYKITSNYVISLSVASIFGENRGIVPDNDEINLPVRDFQTYSKESGYFDHFLVYYPSTFNKYYTYITDLSISYNHVFSQYQKVLV